MILDPNQRDTIETAATVLDDAQSWCQEEDPWSCVDVSRLTCARDELMKLLAEADAEPVRECGGCRHWYGWKNWATEGCSKGVCGHWKNIITPDTHSWAAFSRREPEPKVETQ